MYFNSCCSKTFYQKTKSVAYAYASAIAIIAMTLDPYSNVYNRKCEIH